MLCVETETFLEALVRGLFYLKPLTAGLQVGLTCVVVWASWVPVPGHPRSSLGDSRVPGAASCCSGWAGCCGDGVKLRTSLGLLA